MSPDVVADDKRLRKKLKVLSGYVPEPVPPEIIRLDYEPHPLYLYVTSRVERKSRIHSCAKEPWTVAWLDRSVRPGDVVYDIGANVGAYSLVAAHRAGPSGRVVAIEPGYATFAHLCDNVILNDLHEVIAPLPFALGSRTRLANIYYNNLTPGHARHSVVDGTPPQRDDRTPCAALGAAVFALDDLVSTFTLPPPSHIKIDVDGAEYEVLQGAASVFASPSLRTVLTEVEDVNTDAMTVWLSSRGFELTERHRRVDEDGHPADWWFGLFTRA
jgi:FkbM family methyltransferase